MVRRGKQSSSYNFSDNALSIWILILLVVRNRYWNSLKTHMLGLQVSQYPHVVQGLLILSGSFSRSNSG